MISENERQQLLHVVSQPQFKVIESIANTLISEIQSDSTVKSSEWETLSETLLNEGEVRGIRKFITKLYNEAGNV